MKKHEHIIARVLPDSIAEEMGIEAGDVVLSVNGEEIVDIFDYQFDMEDSYVVLLIRKPNGEEWELEIEKDEKEDIGIEFENSLMDQYRSCRNKCVFCFIDQMPPGMRETLYFKDDDSRLSFLQGNYVTLTNMNDKDIDRIIRYHMSPINISVHTTDPELRCMMLHNRFAGTSLKKIDRLYEGGVIMNGQIVCCKDLNDREELNRTIGDLTRYYPQMQSVSVVPVGLSKYREKLYPLKPLTREDAVENLKIIHHWQDVMMEKYGVHFVHASDEWYLLAGQELPEEERYDGYLQLENGVGMIRLLLEEVKAALEDRETDDRKYEAALATGLLAGPYIEKIAGWIEEKYPGVKLHIYPIRNDFFGENITVSGLITGQDLMAQLKDKELGECLLLPVNMFRSGEETLLDDYTKTDVEQTLKVPVRIVGSSGEEFVRAALGEEEEMCPDYPPYELAD
ncbi:MAG: DUF512 domain-containing protein [Lachnospiraceae bacterium]|nr:DUF512 domain-containing protein [Lachnospiraceae bacterium]